MNKRIVSVQLGWLSGTKRNWPLPFCTHPLYGALLRNPNGGQGWQRISPQFWHVLVQSLKNCKELGIIYKIKIWQKRDAFISHGSKGCFCWYIWKKLDPIICCALALGFQLHHKRLFFPHRYTITASSTPEHLNLNPKTQSFLLFKNGLKCSALHSDCILGS